MSAQPIVARLPPGGAPLRHHRRRPAALMFHTFSAASAACTVAAITASSCASDTKAASRRRDLDGIGEPTQLQFIRYRLYDRLALIHGLPGVLACSLRPVARIASFNCPAGQPTEVRVSNSRDRIIRKAPTQRVEVVGSGKVDSEEHK
jgi:hypothetical protein